MRTIPELDRRSNALKGDPRQATIQFWMAASRGTPAHPRYRSAPRDYGDAARGPRGVRIVFISTSRPRCETHCTRRSSEMFLRLPLRISDTRERDRCAAQDAHEADWPSICARISSASWRLSAGIGSTQGGIPDHVLLGAEVRHHFHASRSVREGEAGVLRKAAIQNSTVAWRASLTGQVTATV